MGIQIIGWIATILISVAGAYLVTRNEIMNSKEQYYQSNCKDEISKAVELAEYYQREILTPISIINFINNSENMKNDGIGKIPISSGEELSFTFNEAKKYINESLIMKYSHVTDEGIDKMRANISRLMPERKDQVAPQTREEAERIYDSVWLSVLNKLEFWCMYFNRGIADEEVVYSCLHQTFLSGVQSLYFNIASKNKGNPKDKYYENIIQMFNRWNKIDVDNNRKIIELNAKVDKELSGSIHKPYTYKEKDRPI